jgi:hypothetical protein
MEHLQTAAVPADHAERIRTIRRRLPGQMLRERIDLAAASHGPLYTLGELRERVGQVLPRRLGFVRGANLEPIETYRQPIPEDALVKYDVAFSSGLFSKFWVATPTYYQERQVDPWIVGEIAEAGLYGVIARWDE